MPLWILISLSCVIFSGMSEAADLDSKGAQMKEQTVMGWIEWAVLIPWGVEVKVKLDSGAKTSSLHAESIERFEKEGKAWVRFIIPIEEKEGEKVRQIPVERPLIRNVKIKRHHGDSQRRPVVSLKFCLNGKRHETQFSLVDRSQLNYPVLLGRRFLKNVAIIDPSKTFLANEGRDACLLKHAPDKTSDKKAQTLQD